MTLKTTSIPHWEDGATNRRGYNSRFFLTALKYKIDSSHPVSPLFITWHKSWQSFFYIPGTALTREHSVSYKMSHWLHSNWKLRIHDTSSGPIFPLIGACPKFMVHWRILRDHKFALMTLSKWKNILIDMILEFLQSQYSHPWELLSSQAVSIQATMKWNMRLVTGQQRKNVMNGRISRINQPYGLVVLPPFSLFSTN